MQAMKLLTLLAVGAVYGTLAEEMGANPLSKVFELIGNLKAKIIADGETEDKAYNDYARWCSKTAASVQNEIDTSTALSEKLTAKVTELSSDIEVADTKVGELSGSISKAESELKAATEIRNKEKAEFTAGEKELMETVDTLERAVSTLEKELSSGGSFAQVDTSNLQSLLQSLSLITDAAGMAGESKAKLLALVQAHDEEDDTGAPAASKYDSHSGGIVDVLEEMKDKAESQLADLRKSETQARNSYAMLKQSLEDEGSATTKELNDNKANKAEAGEEKASSEGNLEVATKETKASNEKLATLQSDCQTAGTDHEANTAARNEEIKAVGQAEKILQETTGGAGQQAGYSFLQTGAATSVSQKSRAMQMATNTLVQMVQNLAKDQHSAALAQLASRISAELRYGQNGRGDPFAKVKGLIQSMIEKLENEASAEATEKAYCDEEMGKTKSKKEELDDIVSALTAKIEKSASKSSSLKQEVADLSSELADLSKEQASMDKIRREENSAYVAAKKDLELGLGGVRKALTVLREFYAQPAAAAMIQTDEDGEEQMTSLMQQPAPPQKAEKSSGAGSGIIGMLEVIESDFAKNLATEDAAESDAQTSFDKHTQANKITKAQKEQDAKYKTQEFKGLDKSIAENTADKATEVQELNAVNEYFGKIKERCVAKPSTYEERKARRDAEVAGLKDALASLESEALMQMGSRSARRAHLRGDTLRTD